MHGGPRHESCSSGFLREKNSPLSAVAGARWDRAPAAAAGLREGRRGGRASPPPAKATQAAHRRRRRRARRPALRIYPGATAYPGAEKTILFVLVLYYYYG